MKLILKILFGIFLLVIVAAGVLYAMGSNPYSFVGTTSIKEEKQNVYLFLTRPALMEQWMPGTKDVAILDDRTNEVLLDENGEQVNFDMTLFEELRAKIVVEEGGQEVIMYSTLVEASYGNKLIYELDSHTFSGTVRYELSYVENPDDPLKPFTEMKETVTIQYKDLYCILAPLLKSSAQKQLENGLASLKKLIEESDALAKYQEMEITKPVNLSGEEPTEEDEGFQGGPSNAGLEAPERPDNPRKGKSDDTSADDTSADDTSADDTSSDDTSSDDTSSDDTSSDDTSADDNS